MAKNRFPVWHLNTIRLVRCKNKMFLRPAFRGRCAPCQSILLSRDSGPLISIRWMPVITDHPSERWKKARLWSAATRVVSTVVSTTFSSSFSAFSFSSSSLSSSQSVSLLLPLSHHSCPPFILWLILLMIYPPSSSPPFPSFPPSPPPPPPSSPWQQTPLLKGNREEFNKHQRSMAIQPNQSSFIITSYIQFNEQNSTNIQCWRFLKAFKKMPRMGTCQELRLDFIASPVLITLTVQQHTASVLLLQIP